MAKENKPTEIIIHHDGVIRPGASFYVINDYHAKQEFPKSSLGFYVGYHYVIEKDGSVHQARKDDEEGAHTKGHNTSSLGICVVGNFDVEMPTAAQLAALGSLLSRLCAEYSIPYTRIVPHRTYANKTCYGRLLSDNWGKVVYLRYELDRLTALLRQLEPKHPLLKKLGLIAH